MSHLATWQGKPRVGIDHAVAAAVWAEQTSSSTARAYAADVAVRAYAADRQPEKCRTTLDREYAALTTPSHDQPTAAWWYFYDEAFYWRNEAECALKQRQPAVALEALDKSLTLSDPSNLHNYTFRLLLRAEARIQQDEIPEASTIIGDVAHLTAVSPSQRITDRVDDLRTQLVPWERTKPVRELDDLLKTYRSGDSGSGNTKRTYSR
jgi:hypothetical protein